MLAIIFIQKPFSQYIPKRGKFKTHKIMWPSIKLLIYYVFICWNNIPFCTECNRVLYAICLKKSFEKYLTEEGNVSGAFHVVYHLNLLFNFQIALVQFLIFVYSSHHFVQINLTFQIFQTLHFISSYHYKNISLTDKTVDLRI